MAPAGGVAVSVDITDTDHDSVIGLALNALNVHGIAIVVEIDVHVGLADSEVGDGVVAGVNNSVQIILVFGAVDGEVGVAVPLGGAGEVCIAGVLGQLTGGGLLMSLGRLDLINRTGPRSGESNKIVRSKVLGPELRANVADGIGQNIDVHIAVSGASRLDNGVDLADVGVDQGDDSGTLVVVVPDLGQNAVGADLVLAFLAMAASVRATFLESLPLLASVLPLR